MMTNGTPSFAPKKNVWREIGVVLGLVTLGLALRLYGLTAESLWFDEAYAVWSSAMDIVSLRVLWEWKIEFALFYVLQHFWMRLFGQGELAVRGFAALAGTLTIIPMYALGKSLFGQRVGALSAFLLAVNPYHVWYSQEVRSYAWIMLFATASLLAFWRLVNGGRWFWWAAHALLTGLAFHLHYYIVWVVLVQNLYFLIGLWRAHGHIFKRGARRELRWWILDQLVVLAFAAPALGIFLTYMFGRNQWSWLEASYRPPRLAELVNLLVAYTTGTIFVGPALVRRLVALAFAGLAVWGIWHVYRNVSKTPLSGRALGLMVLAGGLPVALIFVLGQFSTLWVTRYLLIFLCPFLVLVALGMSALPSSVLRVGAVGLIAAISLVALSRMYAVPQKEDWRGVAAYVAARAGETDLIVLMDEDCRVPFNYYYGPGGSRVEVSRFADAAALDKAVADIRARERGGRVWLVVSHADSAGLEQRLSALPNLALVEAPPFVGIKLVVYRWV